MTIIRIGCEIVTFTRNKVANVTIALTTGRGTNAIGIIIRIRVPDGKCAVLGRQQVTLFKILKVV